MFVVLFLLFFCILFLFLQNAATQALQLDDKHFAALIVKVSGSFLSTVVHCATVNAPLHVWLAALHHAGVFSSSCFTSITSFHAIP